MNHINPKKGIPRESEIHAVGIISSFGVLLLCGALSQAQAGIINILDLAGNFDQGSWGSPNTQFYAQSVAPDDSIWQELTFRVTPEDEGDISYQVLITGARADGGGGLGLAPDFDNILFSTGELSLAGDAGLTEITLVLDLDTSGYDILFFVLDDFSFASTGTAEVRATELGALVDPYAPGEFVFFNTTGQASLAEINLLTRGPR